MSKPERFFSIGVDIGQKVDHSAIALTEELPKSAIVRLLVKYPLGTPWPLLTQTVADLVKSIKEKGTIYHFSVDATGPGSAPSQMIQEALPDIRVDAFIFTNRSKRELVGKVKVMHSYGRLKLATRKGDEVYNRTLSELITEMKQLQAKVIREDSTSPEIEIFKTGAHDDLFTALALSVKDIEFARGDKDILFVEDKSWVQTGLEERQEPTVLFTT